MFKPGELSQQEADKLNWMLNRVQAAQNITFQAPLAGAVGPDGRLSVRLSEKPKFRGRITASGSVSGVTPTAYSWTAMVQVTPGVWQDSAPSMGGVLNAWPIPFDGDTSASATYPTVPIGCHAWFWPSETVAGTWVFEYREGFWVKITAGTGGGPYTGVRYHLNTSGSYVIDSPTVTLTTIYRAPSNLPSPAAGTPPPAIPAEQFVWVIPSSTAPGKYETDAVGGLQNTTLTLLSDVTVACVGGGIVVTKTTTSTKFTGRDLTIE